MKISCSQLNNHRLGNQLFLIAGVLGLAEQYVAEAVFPEWNYEQYFEKPLPHGENQIDVIKEKFYNYHDWELKGNCDIQGYLQSEKYFPKENPFSFKGSFLKPISDKLLSAGFMKKEISGSFELYSPTKETICIHIRRGDYVKNPNYYQLPITYFISALVQEFKYWQECNIVIISDDLSYCKIHFGCLPNVFFADDFNDIESIALASLCDHFILSNSTFSWWAAYLGEKEHSKIVHPGHLFAGKLISNDTKDFWPERWTRFQKEDYKLDITDITFTIPVYYDHKDRKANLDLSVCMLQKDFNTNIIIGEQGSSRFTYMSQYCQYRWFEEMKSFHRTKMLNDMAMMAETPYIANWDADVIIPPMQVYLSVLKLRSGIDMIFPYDGRFARLNRMPWFREIESLLDIAAIGDYEPTGRRGKPVPENSVGGAIFFNKESFIDGGMENEYMISYGPEDAERNDRFKTLGYKVERVCELGTGLGGCLYHLNHFCGANSGNQNIYFAANKEEYNKVHVMDKTALLNYIDTWPWRHKYTESYYKRISEGAIISANEVNEAMDSIGYGMDNISVIDIGCGVGEWNLGNKNYKGVDYKIPKKSLIIKEDQFYECDLEKYSVTLQKDELKYDLCLCLEVAEHISESRADGLIEMLCNLSDNVLFSAAIPFQGGTGHVNEQWQTYWATKFYNNGFTAAINQPAIRSNENIELWYRQNIVLYEKHIQGTGYSNVEDFVLPEYYEQIILNLKNQTI